MEVNGAKYRSQNSFLQILSEHKKHAEHLWGSTAWYEGTSLPDLQYLQIGLLVPTRIQALLLCYTDCRGNLQLWGIGETGLTEDMCSIVPACKEIFCWCVHVKMDTASLSLTSRPNLTLWPSEYDTVFFRIARSFFNRKSANSVCQVNTAGSIDALCKSRHSKWWRVSHWWISALKFAVE